MTLTPADQLKADLETAISTAIWKAGATMPSADWVNGYAAGARTAIDACVKALIVYRGVPTA